MQLTSNYNYLPEKGVLFLGGHHNMTKKLRQQFPQWLFLADDEMKRHSVFNQKLVFYWTAHSSHKLMNYVYSKLPDDAKIIYVTATNIPRLVEEMAQTFQTAE